MSAEQKKAGWYLMESGVQEGPLDIHQLRNRLSQMKSPSSAVARKGEGQWISIEVIRKKLNEVEESGWFLRQGSTEFGPFTTKQVKRKLASLPPSDDAWLRQGEGGNWRRVDAAKWRQKDVTQPSSDVTDGNSKGRYAHERGDEADSVDENAGAPSSDCLGKLTSDQSLVWRILCNFMLAVPLASKLVSRHVAEKVRLRRAYRDYGHWVLENGLRNDSYQDSIAQASALSSDLTDEKDSLSNVDGSMQRFLAWIKIKRLQRACDAVLMELGRSAYTEHQRQGVQQLEADAIESCLADVDSLDKEIQELEQGEPASIFTPKRVLVTFATLALILVPLGVVTFLSSGNEDPNPSSGQLATLTTATASASTASEKSKTNPEVKRVSVFEPIPEIDEELFLLRLLERFYMQWPRDFRDRDLGEAQLAALQANLEIYFGYARSKEMDDQLIRMYEEASELAIDYKKKLIELNIIDETSYTMRQKSIRAGISRVTASALSAAASGGTVGAIVGSPIPGVGNVAGGVIGGVVGGGTAMVYTTFEVIVDYSKVADSQKQAIQHQLRHYEAHYFRVINRARGGAEGLAEKHAWPDFGFDFESESRTNPNLQKHLTKRIESRPNDPFARANRARFLIVLARSAAKEAEIANYLNEAANAFNAAAERVPPKDRYNEIRVAFLLLASRCKSDSFSFRKESSSEPLELVDCAKKYVKPDSPELTAYLHTRAHALARDGQYDKAINTLDEIPQRFRDEGLVNLDRACFCSLGGQCKAAINNLKLAIQNRQHDIWWIRRNPDLRNVSSKQPSEWKQVVTPRARAEFKFGALLKGDLQHDLIVYNESSFPITNTVVRIDLLTRKGDLIANELFFVIKLPPNGKHEYENVFKADYYKLSETECTWRKLFACDQLRVVPAVQISNVSGLFEGMGTFRTVDSKTPITKSVELNLRTATRDLCILEWDGEEYSATEYVDGRLTATNATNSEDVVIWFRSDHVLYGYRVKRSNPKVRDVFWLTKS